jgi:hypothetical protein
MRALGEHRQQKVLWYAVTQNDRGTPLQSCSRIFSSR